MKDLTWVNEVIKILWREDEKMVHKKQPEVCKNLWQSYEMQIYCINGLKNIYKIVQVHIKYPAISLHIEKLPLS